METTTATAKPLTMAAIKSAMPSFFGVTSFEESYQSAYEKGASIEAFARQLAGNATERAKSGNDAGVKFLRSKIESLTLAKKNALASKLRTIEGHIVAIKGQSLVSADIAAYIDYAESQFCEILAVLVPPKADKAPSDKPTALQLAKARIVELETQLAECMAECAALKRAAPVATTV